MDNMKTPDVPYIVHEATMARQERTIKRLWILCLVMFLALVVTNAGWIYYENQWEDVVTTETTMQEVDQDSETGSNTFVGGDYYGEANSKNNQDEDNQNEEEKNRR